MSSNVPYQDAISLITDSGLLTADRINLPNSPFNTPSPGLWVTIEMFPDVLQPFDIGANV